MRNEKDQLIARMRSTIGTQWSDELLHGQAELANLEQYSSHVQHLEQEIGSYDVMEQSLLARAQQLTQQGSAFKDIGAIKYLMNIFEKN